VFHGSNNLRWSFGRLPRNGKEVLVNNLQIALIAGLSGSVATAFLSYLVQHLLAKKRRKEEEQRLAFIYLSKISGMLACEQIIKTLLDTYRNVLMKYLPEQMEVLKPKEGRYEPSHIICVAIYRMLKEVTAKDEKLREFQSLFSRIESGSTSFIEELRIPLPLLSQMPRHAILAYENFTSSLIGLRSAWLTWKTWMDKPDETLIRPNALFGQWLGIQLLSEDASTVFHKLCVAFWQFDI